MGGVQGALEQVKQISTLLVGVGQRTKQQGLTKVESALATCVFSCLQLRRANAQKFGTGGQRETENSAGFQAVTVITGSSVVVQHGLSARRLLVYWEWPTHSPPGPLDADQGCSNFLPDAGVATHVGSHVCMSQSMCNGQRARLGETPLWDPMTACG